MVHEPDASELPEDWADALTSQGCEVGSQTASSTISTRRRPCASRPEECVPAFHLTRLHDVRVVILGQDPYPKRNQRAQGLAFSVPEGVDIPRLPQQHLQEPRSR